MASSPVPAKSQPLHNFSLPQLNWKKTQANNLHRARRPTESPPRRHQSPAPYAPPKQSPLQESASESESGFVSDDHRKGSANLVEKLDNETTKSKIYIRVRRSKVAESVEEENNQEVLFSQNDGTNNHEIEELVEQKTWNLRPRRPLFMSSNGNNGLGSIKIVDNRTQIGRDANNIAEKKEKKQKFSIPLEREEIEEDIFIMTGSRPSRKPKKRAKIVQKQLDNLFPGMWLSSVTADCYKVPDPPIKG